MRSGATVGGSAQGMVGGLDGWIRQLDGEADITKKALDSLDWRSISSAPGRRLEIGFVPN